MQRLGQLVAANIRQNDLAFRYAANAIAIVLGETAEKEGLMVVEKMRRLIATALDDKQAAASLNAGVAEANMMLIGEAFAALGGNAWVSTFCPFFDWKVMRRVAVGDQERHEAMDASDGWLSAGHCRKPSVVECFTRK